MDDSLGKPTQPLFLILQTGWVERAGASLRPVCL